MTSFNLSALDNVALKFEAMDNSRNTLICIASASNNIRKLKALSRMDEYGVRDITENLTCNNTDVTSFAAQYGASKTTKYLSMHAPKKYKINIDDIEIEDIAKNPQGQVIYVVSN